jgi:alpha-D-xyloside xylohydrolase
MPYLYSHSMDAVTSGIPVSLRAMFLEFPDDPTAWTLDRQYMLGDSLLVAPVFSESGDVIFYLPEGRWTNWFTGEVKSGPRWVRETHSFLTLPLYVREGSIIALGKVGEKRVVYDYCKDLEVRAFRPSKNGQWRKMVLVDNNGEARGTFEVSEQRMALPKSLKGELTLLLDGEIVFDRREVGKLDGVCEL